MLACQYNEIVVRLETIMIRNHFYNTWPFFSGEITDITNLSMLFKHFFDVPVWKNTDSPAWSCGLLPRFSTFHIVGRKQRGSKGGTLCQFILILSYLVLTSDVCNCKKVILHVHIKSLQYNIIIFALCFNQTVKCSVLLAVPQIKWNIETIFVIIFFN